jgi:delta14-sterol reductase
LEKQAVQAPKVQAWGSIFTYFYVLYFGMFLIHRGAKDEEKFDDKYGKSREKYPSLGRYKIIPGTF